ncbi:snake venom serine protease KN2-like [Myzus persicae]|uniref:snake venom serine protease KN2-like n=1 Tax=Myzus persicae TaxID=13164 RepID=UPI000B936114|nr:snake venom serine protease KN2-like [Myzus persicae]
MKIIIILLLAIKVAYLSGEGLNHCTNRNLVHNGVQYDDKKYPYVVTIQMTGGGTRGYCTGSMVKKLYVLTAAHCFDGYKVGDVKLPKPFPKLKNFLKIGGHPKDFKGNKSLTCTCIGFGKTRDGENAMGFEGCLMNTTITYGQKACRNIDNLQFKKAWKEYLCSRAGRITMICSGDSGGPMICKNKLYGVCSFTYNFMNGSDICGGANLQTVHTFLHYHLKWINNIINPGANSGLLLKQHQLHTIVAISLCILLLF